MTGLLVAGGIAIVTCYGMSALLLEALELTPLDGWQDHDSIYFPDPVWVIKTMGSWICERIGSLVGPLLGAGCLEVGGGHADQLANRPPVLRSESRDVRCGACGRRL